MGHQNSSKIFRAFTGTLLVSLSLALVPGAAPGLAQTPKNDPHPSYTFHNMRPNDFEPLVGGIDWLSDGRMVLAHWGVDMKVEGKVYILTGMAGTDRSQVKWTEFATGLKEPLGLVVVNDIIHVFCKDGLWKLTDPNNNGKSEGNEKIKLVSGWSYPAKAGGGERWHLFNFGLVQKDGLFYGNLGGEFPPSTTQGKDRGSLISMDAEKGTFKVLTGGLRTPNGLVIGPEGEFFGTDNQGHYQSSNKLNNFREGRNYGMPNDPAHPYDVKNVPTSPPAIWLQQGEMSNSPSDPVYITEGTYAGQMLVGDVRNGYLLRMSLEKVDNEWQGAAYLFGGGFEAGINRIKFGPDGHLYVGQIGDKARVSWNFKNKLHGFSKMVNNGKLTHEILAVRSRSGGMEIEFTKPLENAASQIAKYQVRSWVNLHGQQTYGAGAKQNVKDHTVKSVTVSPDKKKVMLAIDDLQKGRVIYIKAGVNSSTGETPWASEAWYTLNFISNTDAFTTSIVDSRLKSPEFLANKLKLTRQNGQLQVQVPFEQAFSVTLRDLQGKELAVKRGDAPTLVQFSLENRARGTYFVETQVDGQRFVRSFVLH